jgi:hypothetical protein
MAITNSNYFPLGSTVQKTISFATFNSDDGGYYAYPLILFTNDKVQNPPPGYPYLNLIDIITNLGL